MKPIFLAFIVLFITFSAKANLNPQPKIIGGTTSSQSYSWMVSIQSPTSHFCGGVLIHQDFVLTAAHCLQDFLPEQLTLIIGSNDRINGIGGETREADWYYNHPSYDVDTFLNDIAIIKLNESSNNEPIDIASPSEFSAIQQNTQLKVMGWGLTQEGDIGSSPIFLNEVAVSFQNDAVCFNTYGDQGKLGYWNQAMCAGEVSGGQDSCLGDSGGPIVLEQNNETHLVGLVSWGAGCGLAELYGVYNEVSAFQDWIHQRLYGLTVTGIEKIGFVAEGYEKQEPYRVVNQSKQATVIDNAFFELVMASSFSYRDDAGVLAQVPAASECDFVISAEGSTVGEQEGQFVVNQGSNSTAINLNSKVLKFLDLPVANLPWSFFTGTQTQVDPNTDHSEPWYGINAGDAGIALSSGSIDHNERSVLLTYLKGPEEGNEKYLRFDAKVDSELPDGLYTFVNESSVNALSANEVNPHFIQQAGQFNQWFTYQFQLTEAFNHVMFIYRKDDELSSGSDRALVNNFRLCASIDQADESCTKIASDFADPSNFPINLGQTQEAACRTIEVTEPVEVEIVQPKKSSGGTLFYLLGLGFLFLFRKKALS